MAGPMRYDRYRQYMLIDRLNTGGEAEVWKAITYNSIPEEEVALRILTRYENTGDIRRRFEREVQKHQSLNGHRHIIPLLDSGWDHEKPYLVMPYIPDGSLGDVLKEGKKWPSSKECLTYIQQTAEALSYAHEKGIIHRDVKPANLLLGSEGILLSDFGLVIDAAAPLPPTRDWGSDYYCPPEQYEGRPVPASDQYALTVTLCKLLTRQYPKKDKNKNEKEHGKEELQKSFPNIAKVFMRAWDDDPTKRFPSMEDFRSVLSQAVLEDLPEQVTLTPSLSVPPPPSRIQPPLSRMSLKPNLAQVIRIFVSCAEDDIEFLHALERQLSTLVREELIKCYNRYRLIPGTEWKEKVKEYLHTADIILLLVSPFYVASDDCYKEEAVPAMALHNSGKTRVIPVIVRPTIEWEQLVFGELASLPRGEAVSMWPNKEEAFSNIVKGIKETIDELRSKIGTSSLDRPLPFWNVPYWRNPFFTGREDVLVDLQSAFVSQKAPLQVQALSGLAGVGKTQIAVEYAYRYASKYQAVLWVHADSPEILLSSFVELSEVLDLPEKKEADQPLIVKAVKQWLQRNARWLLVVDNLEDIDLLRDMVPSPHSGHILVTIRSHRTGQIAHRVDLEPMQIDDGALLLLRRAKLLTPGTVLNNASEVDSAVAKKIAQAVHGLPLALDQAGAYIEETGRGLSDYVDLYQQYASSLLKRRGASGQDHPESVTTTFSLSFEKVKTLNSTAIELLEFCAFLHPDAIPEELFIGGAPALPPLLHTAATDPIEFDRAIEDLLKFSLIQRKSDQNILIVHRLVQAVVKETISKERQHEYIEQTVRVIDAIFPPAEFSNWPRCQRYLLQAQTAAKLIEQENMLLPEASQLLCHVGGYLHQRGLYDEAERLLLQASVMAEALFGGDHPTLLPILNTLAKVYYLQGRYSQAEPILLRSLTLGEKLLGTEHPEIGDSLNRLGRTYHKQGRYSEAEPLLQRALALRQKVLGPQHPEVAMSMDSLALLYNRQGKYEQAEALYTQALTIRQAMLDPQDPDIAANLNNLAVFYGRRGKYEQAEPLAEQAVKIYEQAFGQEHPRFVNILDTLAEIYQEQGKYTQAEPLYQRIFTVSHKRLGPEHPQLVEYGNHLARLYFLQGKYTEAEATARQALTLGEKVLGQYHHRVGTTLNTLADVCKAQEKYVEAEEFYAQALKVREQVLATNDVNTAITLESYADLLQTMGRQTEAEELKKRAAAIRHEQSTN